MSRNPYAEHKPKGGSGSYLRFETDKQVRVRVVSDPVIFDSIYEGRVSVKYALLVYNIDEEEVQIMQLPKTGFIQLGAIAADEDYGNPMENDYDLKITRTGQKQQTKYNIVPVAAKVKLDEDIKAAIEDIDLVERINASPSSDRAAWVLDEVDGKRPEESKKVDEVAEVKEDEEIDLDDLPL